MKQKGSTKFTPLEIEMRYTWEECDIRAGRRISAHNRSEQFLIGWSQAQQGVGVTHYHIISLADGMTTTEALTKLDMKEYLNKFHLRPDDILLGDINLLAPKTS